MCAKTNLLLNHPVYFVLFDVIDFSQSFRDKIEKMIGRGNLTLKVYFSICTPRRLLLSRNASISQRIQFYRNRMISKCDVLCYVRVLFLDRKFRLHISQDGKCYLTLFHSCDKVSSIFTETCRVTFSSLTVLNFEPECQLLWERYTDMPFDKGIKNKV